MDFFTVVEQRYSVRAYRDTPVADADLQRILHAANDAPSAGNLQPYEIVVVRDTEAKQQLAQCCFGQMFIATAPVVLVFFANPDRSRVKYGDLGTNFLCVQDATIACAHAHLAAAALGLGSCWIGAFNDAVVHQVTGVPAEWRTMALLPIGYPADARPSRTRRPLTDVVRKPAPSP